MSLNDFLTGANNFLSGINDLIYNRRFSPGQGLLKAAKTLATESVKTAETARKRPVTPLNLLKTLGGSMANVAGAPFEAVGQTTRSAVPDAVQKVGVDTPVGRADVGGLVDLLAQSVLPVGGGTSKLKNSKLLSKLFGKGIETTVNDLGKVRNIPRTNTFVPKGQELLNVKPDKMVPLPQDLLKTQRTSEDIVKAGKKSGALMNEPPSNFKDMISNQKGFVNFGAKVELPKLGSSLTKELKPITAKEAALKLPKVSPEDVMVQTDKLLDKQYGRTLLQKVTRAFPYADESAKVSSTGTAGQEIVARGRRVNASTLVNKNEAYKELDKTGLLGLTPEELKNLTLAREGREQFLSSKVMDVSSKIDEGFIGKAPSEIGFQAIEQYAPRRPNEAGLEYLKKNQGNIEEQLIQKVMKEQNITDKSEAVKIIRGGQRKAFFEKERLLDTLPDEYRDFSARPWLDYASEYARRKAVTKEFGIGEDIVNKLKLDVGPDHLPMVDKYINRIKGNAVESKDLKGLSDFIKNSMVLSKLTPLTTAANELQAHASSFLTDGVSGIVRAMKPGGKKLVDELGLDTMKGKFGDFVSSEGMASKWLKMIGMSGSEARGIERSTKATWDGIDAAWKRLVKNPEDIKAKKYLNELAMYIDPKKLADDLKSGAMSAEEKAIGAIEGARQKMFFPTAGERPGWANSPIGSSAYIFHNYILHQMNLLRKAPLSRQIAYVAVIAPATGLPIAYLRNMLTGKEQPTTPQEMWSQGARYGPATPLELNYTLGSERGLLGTMTGGFSPYANMGIQAMSGNGRGLAKETFKAAPIPFSNLIAPALFPSKTQQKANTRPVPGGSGGARTGSPKTYSRPTPR